MKKAGLVLSVLLTATIFLGAAAQDAPDAQERAKPEAGSARLAKSRAFLAAANAFERLGKVESALADYTEAIDAKALPRQEQARAVFDRGLLLDEMNRLADAVGDYSAALALSPRFAAALNNRANVYRRLNRFDEARRDYLASLAAHNPQSQYSYYGLGQIAEAKGDQQEARSLYQQALAADPGFALAGRHLAALDQEPIHLHPPRESRAVAEDPVAAEAAAPQVVLRPPAAARAGLHRSRVLAPVPAAYSPPGPALKPSLDGVGHRGRQVQLGAWRSQAEAEAGWASAVKRAEGALEGFSPRIVAVDLPKGRYYRLRVDLGSESPQGLCTRLAAKGLDCIPARD